MQRKISQALLLAGVVTSTSLFAYQDDWSMNHRWTVTGDWVYLQRRTLRSKRVAKVPVDRRDLRDKKDRELFTRRAIKEFDYESGYQVALRYDWTCKHSFVGNYMHSGEWSGSSSIKGVADIYYPFKRRVDTPASTTETYSYSEDRTFSNDFNNASYAGISYTSQLDSAELNWLYHLTPERQNYFAMATVMGLRYLVLDEKFQLAMRNGTNRSTYDIDSKDRMFGGQLGLNFQWNPMDCLSWDLMPRVGFFNNDFKQSTFLGDNNNTTTLTKYSRSGTNLAYLAEFIIKASYQLGCHFNLHAGYHFLYLDKMGLAPEQVGYKINTSSNTLSEKLARNGSAYIGGWFAGINFSF